MQENGAAPAANRPRQVVVEDHKHIVEVIVTPQALMACGVGQANGTVVAAVRRVVAPAVVAADRRYRKARDRAAKPVRTVEDADQPVSPRRSGSVGLPFVPRDSGAT